MQNKTYAENVISLKSMTSDGERNSDHELQTYFPSTLEDQERMLKDLWNIYSDHIDRFGENKQTKNLRDRYFNLLKVYRKNKK